MHIVISFSRLLFDTTAWTLRVFEYLNAPFKIMVPFL